MVCIYIRLTVEVCNHCTKSVKTVLKIDYSVNELEQVESWQPQLLFLLFIFLLSSFNSLLY